jgi:hypothetical protein
MMNQLSILFIRCTFAKLIWRVVHFTFNILPPTNIKNLFGNWLNEIDKKTKARIRVGVCVLVLVWVWKFGIAEMRFFFSKASNARLTSTYGHWMYSIDGGRSGYLKPGWLVAF